MKTVRRALFQKTAIMGLTAFGTMGSTEVCRYHGSHWGPEVWG